MLETDVLIMFLDSDLIGIAICPMQTWKFAENVIHTQPLHSNVSFHSLKETGYLPWPEAISLNFMPVHHPADVEGHMNSGKGCDWGKILLHWSDCLK